MDNVNLRGHFHRAIAEVLDDMIRSRIETIKIMDRIDRPVDMDLFGRIGDCHNCGEEVRLVRDGDGWTVDNACEYPEGILAYSVEIDVPSGRLALGNDFRRQFPLLEDFYVNLGSEIKRCTEAYAAQGMVHVFVGNTCPEVRQLDDATIIIGVSGNRERLPGTKVGHIGTDLWWASAADMDHLTDRAAKLGKGIPADIDVVSVAPGRYRATIYYHTLDRDYSPTSAVYVTIENIDDVSAVPFPPVPTASDRGFEREVILSRLSYPSIYPTRACVLNQYFCVNGNGMEWFDGALVGGGSRRHKALKRLEAGEQVTWENKPAKESFYPMCEYSRMACVPDNVRPDWLAGVRETIELVLATDPNAKANGHPNSKNIELAQKVKADLLARFPIVGPIG